MGGKEFEATYAKDKSLPDPNSTDNAEFKCILQLLKDSIPADPTKYTRMAAKCKGVSEETSHRRDDRRQACFSVRLWRRGQGLRFCHEGCRSTRSCHRDRSNLCTTGMHGGFPGRHFRIRRGRD